MYKIASWRNLCVASADLWARVSHEARIQYMSARLHVLVAIVGCNQFKYLRQTGVVTWKKWCGPFQPNCGTNVNLFPRIVHDPQSDMSESLQVLSWTNARNGLPDCYAFLRFTHAWARATCVAMAAAGFYFSAMFAAGMRGTPCRSLQRQQLGYRVWFRENKRILSMTWVSMELGVHAHTHSHRPNIQASDEANQVVANYFALKPSGKASAIQMFEIMSTLQISGRTQRDNPNPHLVQHGVK